MNNYEFIEDETLRFSDHSKVYKVFKNKEEVSAIVLGYDASIKKIYFTLLGTYYTGHNIDNIDYLNIIASIISLFPFFSSDIVTDKENTNIDFSIDNFIIYIGDVYLNKDKNEKYYFVPVFEEMASPLLSKGILEPYLLENFYIEEDDTYDCEYLLELANESYINTTQKNLDAIYDFIQQTDCEINISLGCTINSKKFYEEVELYKRLNEND